MIRGLPLLACLLSAVLLCGVAQPVAAQVGAQVGEHSHRLNRLYDFEDTDDRGNKIGFAGHLLPRNWYIIGREPVGASQKFRDVPNHQALEARQGYPNYAEVGFDRKVKASGDFSLRLGLSGGRTGAFVQHGAINVKPESDYRVTAKVYTDKLDFAWAELRAYFLDGDGNPITQSLRRSDPIVSDGRWKDVWVKLPGEFKDAEYLGIELHIIQPGMDRDDPIGEHQVVPSDIDGGAWFDDIGVWELPSLSISTGVDTNIVNMPAVPKLHTRVRDLTGQRLRATVSVYDHRYRLVDRIQEDIDKEGWSWVPDLAGRLGWYWADLEIHEVDARKRPTMLVARTVSGFLWQAADKPGSGDDLARFVVVAEDTPTEHLPLVEQLLGRCGLTSLVVSGWERGGTIASTAARARVIEPIVRDLIVRRGKVSVSFWPIPAELAGRAGVDASDPLNLLSKPHDSWMDYARPFLSPLGQRLTRWQVGSSSQPRAFHAKDLASDLDAARHGIRMSAPSPRLVAPWRLDQPNRQGEVGSADRYAVAWPQGVVPGKLEEALEGWPMPPRSIRLDIQLADAVDMDHQRRVADLMLRVLHAWEIGVDSLGLIKPWAESHDRHAAFIPDPVLGVWVNLARHLEGQQVIGRMPLAPGIQAMILDGQQGGMLAVWNENATEDPARFKLHLGDDPYTVDPYGNTSPLAEERGKHILKVGTTPTLIRGIDPRIAMFRAGFSLDDPFIESLQVAHRRVLRIHNPWPRTLNGFFTFTGPDRWTTQPQRKHVSIAPGATAEIDVAMRFPIHENGGYKTLVADFVFNVGSDYALTLSAPMEVGLKGAIFDATAIVTPGAVEGTVDAIVTLNVTNTSDAARSLNLFAGIQGHPRREMILPGIAPGEFVSRQIRFKNVGKQIGQSPLRCGVRESNGPAVLNKTLELNAPREKRPAPEVAGAEVQ